MTYERRKYRILNPNSTPACSFYSSTRIQDWNDNFSAVSHKKCWYDQFIKQFSLPPQITCTGTNNHLNRSKHLVKQASNSQSVWDTCSLIPLLPDRHPLHSQAILLRQTRYDTSSATDNVLASGMFRGNHTWKICRTPAVVVMRLGFTERCIPVHPDEV